MELHTVALTGNTGEKLRGIVDYCVCVPSNETARIQECHGLIGHILSELVEQTLFNKQRHVSGS
jgi:D-sedoheptulose 7-phosphate isomerase